jgi:hypothetical protein
MEFSDPGRKRGSRLCSWSHRKVDALLPPHGQLDLPVSNAESVRMSHHFDTPTAREDSRINVCDFYLFRERPGFTVMAMTVNPDAHHPRQIHFVTKACTHSASTSMATLGRNCRSRCGSAPSSTLTSITELTCKASRFGARPVRLLRWTGRGSALAESRRARCVSRRATTPESTEGRVVRVVVRMERETPARRPQVK